MPIVREANFSSLNNRSYLIRNIGEMYLKNKVRLLFTRRQTYILSYSLFFFSFQDYL